MGILSPTHKFPWDEKRVGFDKLPPGRPLKSSDFGETAKDRVSFFGDLIKSLVAMYANIVNAINTLSTDHADLTNVTANQHHAQVHAPEHVTGGGDVVPNVVAAGNAGLMTGADKTKLDGIVEDAAYGVGWDGDTTHAPSQNAVYDKINSMYDKVVQVVNTQISAVATGTTIIPFDDTIPQITEGDEYITQAITPTSASNYLIIDMTLIVSVALVKHVMMALFQDATANTLATTAFYAPAATAAMILTMRYYMVAGTTSETTFRVRVGPHGATTLTLNGTEGNRKFGGVTISSITITEVGA